MRVKAIWYVVTPSELVEYTAGATGSWVTPEFRARLRDGCLVLLPRVPFATEQECLEAAAAFMRAWQAFDILTVISGVREFEYERERVRRYPDMPGARPVSTVSSSFTVSSSIQAVRPAFPAPPPAFVVTPDVEAMLARYEGYKAGREPLTSMAYFVSTLFETSAGGRASAVARYGVSENVLKKIAHLSSSVGVKATARKWEGKQADREHTQPERKFLEAAVRALIRRAGEWEADPSVSAGQITLGDLPTL